MTREGTQEVDTMRPRVCLAIVGALLLATTPGLRADTQVGGPILTDTTWGLAGSPYVVTVAAGGSIVVGGDATLTIEPGVEVRFEPELALLVGWSAWGPGTLVARGTEQSPILFTSDQPDPAPGDWSRIVFLDLATDATFDGSGNYQAGCILEHVVVEYAGSGDSAAISVEQSAPYLSYCEVRENLKRGMAVYSAPPLRIENCYVHDNQDGGMYFQETSDNTLTGNTISGNSASDGGGIYFWYSDSNTLSGNMITGNNAAQSAGGGIVFHYSASNTLTGNMISGNSANESAGGIFFYYSGSNALTDNTISGNSGNYAGGIRATHGGSDTLSDNTISDNSAVYRGGGFDLHDYNGNTLSGNRISGNSAGSGAGMYWHLSGSNTLTGNAIEDNTATGEGGAMFLDRSDNNGLFANNTIRFNHTTGGQTGGIFVTGGTEWLSLNGGPDAYNTICCNDGYDVYNDNTFYGDDARHDIDAKNVFWGTNDTAEIQAEIYDFFDDSSRAVVLWYPYVWNPPAGDLDGDGCVGHPDLGILLADWNCTGGDCPGDCDGDGDTDHADLGILLADWGSECSCQCD